MPLGQEESIPLTYGLPTTLAGCVAAHGYGHGKRLLGYMIEEVIQEIGFAIVSTEPDVEVNE
jgi:hypothetical protein